MADLAHQDQPGADHFRLIGDLPYLLIEFRGEEEDVLLDIQSHGLDCEQSPAWFAHALREVLKAIENSEEYAAD